MAKKYDLVVVGVGSAAMSAVMTIRKAGWSVAVIDFRPFGGTCALRGCDPKKILVTGKGVAPLHGYARFTGSNRMEVDGEAIEGNHFLLAAGAEAVKLGIPGEDHVVTNEEFLNLEKLPQRILLVGGGFIAAEFSHIAARAGANVTVLQSGERMLPQFDPDLVDFLMEKFRAVGIDVRTKTRVEAVEKTPNGFLVRASSDGKIVQFEADLVVHAAGRKPDLQRLNLQAANVAVNDGKLALNDFLQSESNPLVYAAGDAAQKGPPLTPVSSYDSEIVASNLLNGNHRKPDYKGVPSVAFTVPPIAAVGMTEAQARKQGLKFRTNYKRVPEWYTARRVAEPIYGFKVLVEEKSECILGAHLVGPHVDEVINLFAFAIRKGMTAQDLKTAIFAYPTGASDIASML